MSKVSHRIGLWSPIQSRSSSTKTAPTAAKKAAVSSKKWYEGLSAADVQWYNARAAIRKLMRGDNASFATTASVPAIAANAVDARLDATADRKMAMAAEEAASTVKKTSKKRGGRKITEVGRSKKGKAAYFDSVVSGKKTNPHVTPGADGTVTINGNLIDPKKQLNRASIELAIAKKSAKSNGKKQGGWSAGQRNMSDGSVQTAEQATKVLREGFFAAYKGTNERKGKRASGKLDFYKSAVMGQQMAKGTTRTLKDGTVKKLDISLPGRNKVDTELANFNLAGSKGKLNENVSKKLSGILRAMRLTAEQNGTQRRVAGKHVKALEKAGYAVTSKQVKGMAKGKDGKMVETSRTVHSITSKGTTHAGSQSRSIKGLRNSLKKADRMVGAHGEAMRGKAMQARKAKAAEKAAAKKAA